MSRPSPPLPPRLFLLSPAHVAGLRAKLLLNPQAPFPLAREFHRGGLPLAAVFTFASGLYFRGKVGYATHFARVAQGDLVRIISSNRGLLDPTEIVGPREIAALGVTDIDADDPAYRRPLLRNATRLSKQLGAEGRAILLGSIATPKYREPLLEVFGERLLFPTEFVGRGDMSRGALLLRAVRDDRELDYVEVHDAVLRGRRATRVSELGKESMRRG